MPRIRLLPILIVLAGLMLSIRIGSVWDGMSTDITSVRVEQTAAVAQEPDADAAAAGDEAAPVDDAADNGDATAEDADIAALEEEQPQAPPSRRDGVGAFTQSEIDLLQRLSERREELDVRERELDQREAILQAAEDRIDRKIGDLSKLEDTIEALLTEQSEEEKAKVAKLVNIYKAMKPKDAARILNETEMSILLDLFVSMTERNSASILAEMDPIKAQAVTRELATRQSIPLPADAPQGG